MFLSIGMLKQNYFLADIFILSAEKQPIKLSWRKIECLHVYTYRVTLEHFRICEVMDGLTSQPLYEVENSAYLSEMLMTGMRELYGSLLNVRHYTISTTEHIIDVLTAETYVIE